MHSHTYVHNEANTVAIVPFKLQIEAILPTGLKVRGLYKP
jgi:hypothetical protein